MDLLERLAAEETAQRSNTHSRPYSRVVEPEVLTRALEQETADRQARENMGVPIEKANVETPPSIYSELHGRTIISELFKVLDTAHTTALNSYIVQKMHVGKMQDTRENYERVLHNLMAKNNVNERQDSGYVLQRLALYLNGSRMDDEDSLVLAVIKKGAKHGKRN